MRFLVAEDDRDMNMLITRKLRSQGYSADACYDGEEAMDALAAAEYDGLILDVMMPGADGFAVLRSLRSRGDMTPVLFLTALSDTRNIVRGLDLGASDYMVKPFELTELLARIRVMLRNPSVRNENTYICGDIVINTSDRSVTRAGDRVDLTAKEYALLLYLVRNKNMVLTRQQIESNVWDLESDIASNIVDVYIRFIRKKLNAGGREDIIRSVRGVGYILKDSPEEEN